MATINELLIKLEADTTQLRRAMDQVDKQVNQNSSSIQKALGKIDGGVAALGNGFKSLLPALGVAALVGFAKSSLAAAADIGEMAEQLGISTDALQTYQFAAGQSGVKAEEMQTAVARLTRTIGDASNGNSEAIKSFRDLGIGILDAGGNLRTTEAILNDIADAIERTEDPAKRAAAAVDFFGKSGQKLLPLLSGGSAGIRAFTAEARAAGQVISNALIKDADAAADKMAALNAQIQKFGQLGAAFGAGPIGDALTKFNLFLESFRSPDLKSFAALNESIAETSRLLDQARAKQGNRLFGDVFGAEGAGLQRIGELETRLKRLSALRDEMNGRGEFSGEIGRRLGQMPAGRGNTNPQDKAQTDAIKAATDALQKKVAAQRAEAESFGQSESQKAVARATEETLTALRAKGIEGLNAEQKALLANLGVQIQRIEAQKTEIENVKAHAQTLNEYVDNATEAANAEAVLSGQVLKTSQATDEQVRLLNEQAEAAGKSTIRYNALTRSFELYDRELQVVVKTQELLAQNTALSTEEARRQAEVLVDASDKLKKGTDDVQKRVDNMNEAAQDFSRVIGTAFEDAILSGGKFSDVLKGLERDIARIILRMTVTKPLENALQGALGGGGGLFSIFGGGGSGGGSSSGIVEGEWDWMKDIFGSLPGFADGGRPPVGVPSMVGERGPELFVPDRAGTIVPNHALRSGGDTFHVSEHFHFTGDVTAQTRAEVLRLAPTLQQQTIAAIENRQRRGNRA